MLALTVGASQVPGRYQIQSTCETRKIRSTIQAGARVEKQKAEDMNWCLGRTIHGRIQPL